VFACQPFARAPDASLDLVCDRKRAVFAAEVRRGLQVTVLRDVNAFALDRFEEEGRVRFCLELVFQGGQVVYGDGFGREKRPETVAEFRVAVSGERSVAQAVKRMIEVEDLVAARSAAREFDGPLVGLRAGIYEEYGIAHAVTEHLD
jgi:hypothetical protein